MPMHYFKNFACLRKYNYYELRNECQEGQNFKTGETILEFHFVKW